MKLVLMDVLHIQKYIFMSNKLRSIVGASQAVYQLTHEDIPRILEENAYKGNKDWEVTLDKTGGIETGDDYEVIYLGGGNAKILFNKDPKNFIRAWTKNILTNYPGIQPVIAVKDNVEMNNIKQAADAAERLLKENRAKLHLSNQNVAYPVFARSKEDGLPASLMKDGEKISASEKVKYALAQAAENRLQSTMDVESKSFPHTFNELKGEGRTSNYMAVIQADGNSIGKKYIELMKYTDDKNFIVSARKFSRYISDITETALKETVKNNTDKREHSVKPLVFGGDDIVIVSAGDIALKLCKDLADNIDKAFNSKPEYKKFFGDKFSFGFGVVINHKNFPFYNSYTFSHALLANAKKHIKSNNEEEHVIDWHISPSSIIDDLDKLRKEGYEIAGKHLTMKPYYLTKNNAIRNMDSFTKAMIELKSIPRSKYKSMMNKLRTEPENIEEFMLLEMKNEDKDTFKKLLKIFNKDSDVFMTIEDREFTPLIDLIESDKFISGEKNE